MTQGTVLDDSAASMRVLERSRLADARHRLPLLAKKNPVGAAALGVLLLVVVLAIGAPLFAPADPIAQDYDALLKAPSLAHPFGTDRVGRDILSRVIYGTRISILVGVVAVGIAEGQ